MTGLVYHPSLRFHMIEHFKASGLPDLLTNTPIFPEKEGDN